MTPRRLYKAVLVAVVLAAGAAGVYVARQPQQPSVEEQSRSAIAARALLDSAQVGRGTVLRPGQAPVGFAIPAGAASVRLLMNVNLPDIEAARAARRADATKRWPVAVEVEALDAHGATISRRAYHYRPDLSEVRLPDGTVGTGSFYIGKGALAPLGSIALRLDFAGARSPDKVRVRLLSIDPGIEDVLVRLQVPQPATQRDALTMWRRLNPEQKERLAAGNLFPHEALVAREQAALMESRWTPVGPTTPAAARDLYVLGEADRGEPVLTRPMAGVPAGPGRVFAMQLPEEGAALRISLDPLEPTDTAAGQVAVRWSGLSAFERRAQSLTWQAGRLDHSDRFAGGWLEVDPSKPSVLRVWATQPDGSEREVTPEPEYQRLWSVREHEMLDFAVEHAAGADTPMRLVMRRIRLQDDAFAELPVNVALIGADGQVLRRTPVSFAAAPSRHDHVWPEQAGAVVSEPFEVFYRLPVAVQRVRIESASPLLVAAFSRPIDLPRQVQTPEDTADPMAAKTRIPAWFALRPVDYEEKMVNGATRLITIQPRPPEDRPDLVAGNYAWEDFVPRGGGAARVFLAPREAGVPDRTEALGATFRPLPAGPVRVYAEPGRLQVPVRLAWVRTDAKDALQYRVRVDQGPWMPGASAGQAGEAALAPIEPGMHRIEVDSGKQVRWYASHLGAGQPWVRRSAQRFERPLEFELVRATDEEEFVSVRLFRPAGAAQRMRVKVRLQPPPATEQTGPLPGWLFVERVHDVRPSGESALPIAETAGERTDAGQPFFILLPKGAARGTYRIRLEPEGGQGWVSMSRITPGVVARRQILVESVRREQ